MKHLFFLAIVFLSLVLFFPACGNEPCFTMIEISQEEIEYKQDCTVYDYDILGFLQRENPDMESFCEKNGISHYKSINDMKYIVVNTTEGLFVVFFSADGKSSTIEKVSFSLSSNKANVEKLCEGSDLQAVLSADPDGQYPFLFAGWSGYPKYSYHFFEDGEGFFILYDTNIISSVTRFTI